MSGQICTDYYSLMSESYLAARACLQAGTSEMIPTNLSPPLLAKYVSFLNEMQVTVRHCATHRDTCNQNTIAGPPGYKKS